MKFSEIPQFTRHGSWECDFSLDHFAVEIGRMTTEDGLQLNPDFQRGHVWTEAQQIGYVEFLLKGGKTARVVYLNNPNWHNRADGYKEFVCVDGLQRITAVTRFVNNEIPAFGHLFNEFEDTPRLMQNTMRINVNDLKTRREVLQWYIDFNSGGTVHTDDEINKVRALLEAEPADRRKKEEKK
jgi:uncharacterized protein with ParB-like and HNH nuclease domain